MKRKGLKSMARRYDSTSDRACSIRNELNKDRNQKEQTTVRVKKIVALGIFLITAIILIVNVLKIVGYNGEIEKLNIAIAKSTDIYNAKNEAMKNVPEVVEWVDPVISNAPTIGKDICNLQNSLSAVYNKELKDKQLNENSKESLGLLTDEHKKLLQDLSYYFSDAQDNRRVTWCRYGVWTCDNNFKYEGDVTTIVLKCYAPDDIMQNHLLAYAYFSYNNRTADRAKYQNAEDLKKIDRGQLDDVKILYTAYFDAIDRQHKDKPVIYPDAAPDASQFDTNEPY